MNEKTKTKKFLHLYFSNGQFETNSEKHDWDISSMPNGYAVVRITSLDGKQTITFKGLMVIKEMEVE